MEREKLLIVEDDNRWTANYKRWLKEGSFDFNIDSAESADHALTLLRENYYAIVLLDLSLHPTHSYDRSSEEVQKFVKNKAEGTKHIIISNHADKEDIQLGAYTYKAFGTIFKEQFEEIMPFLECVNSALVESKKDRPDFLKEGYDVFIGSENKSIIEHKILTNIKPDGGLTGWFSFKERFFNLICPIYPHRWIYR